MSVIDSPFRASDLGPVSDPDEMAIDEISEDDDFREEFVIRHRHDIIALIETPSYYPVMVKQRKAALERAFRADLEHELRERRASHV